MRAFICIDFPDEIIKEIARIQNLLQKKKFTGKLTELENLHLTLKFLSEITPEMLEKTKELLSHIHFSKFEAKLLDAGTFNHNGKPSIVWIKIGGKQIFELQKEIDKVLSQTFSKEERFMSHLTIARIKYVKNKQDFKDYIKNLPLKSITFPVTEFKLKSSELKPLGPVYTTMKTFSLITS